MKTLNSFQIDLLLLVFVTVKLSLVQIIHLETIMEETTFLRHSQLMSEFHLFYPGVPFFLETPEDQVSQSH